MMSKYKIFGLKKSAIKKFPIVKQLFDLRDYFYFVSVYRLIVRRHIVLSKSTSGMCILVNYHGGNFKLHARRFPSSDLFVLNQVFNLDCFGAVHKLIDKNYSAESINRVIDAGANVGYSVLCWAHWFPNANILAIEPDADNITLAIRNAEFNCIPRVKYLLGALWSSCGSVTVERDFRDNRDASITVLKGGRGKVVQAVTLESLMLREGWSWLDLLKIDIEGAEAELFKNDESFIEILGRTRFLVIEVHQEFRSLTETISLLEGIGFTCETIGDLTSCVNHRFEPNSI